jgi:Tfp pilus assembly protein PilF
MDMVWLIALALAATPGPSLPHALEAEQAGNDPAAASELAALLKADPTHGLAHLEAGRLALKRDDLDGARLQLGIASALLPENPRAQYLLGMAELGAGAETRAQADLERAVILRPAYREARLRLGALYLKMGDAAKAQAQFEHAVAQDPSDVGATLQLARAQEANGQTDAAEATLLALHQAQPELSFVTRALAQLYERTGRPALARKVWETLEGPKKRRLRPLRPSRR